MKNNVNIEISYEELLEKGEKIIKSPVGVSMYPMLKQGQDLMVIEKITKPLSIDDVVLFKRVSGDYVLHRIKKIIDNEYVIRGDNCYYDEHGILREQIIGILKGFYKKERYIDCDKNILYKIYILIIKIRHKILKINQKITYVLRKYAGKQ